MANQYLLNFLIRGHGSPIEFEVRESHWLRAQDMFDRAESFYHPARFLSFATVDGLDVAVGFLDVQSVRFIYHPVEYPSDQKHKDDDVRVWLRGRDEPVVIRTDDKKDSLSAFFIAIDTGAELAQFPGLTDENGEIILFNADELSLVTAPMHDVREGYSVLMADPDSDSADNSTDIPF